MTASVSLATGVSIGMPIFGSVLKSPGPMPSVALPLDISSIVQIADAVTAGLCVKALVMPGPILILEVFAAISANISKTLRLL